MVETEFERQWKLNVLQLLLVMFDTGLLWIEALIKKNAYMNHTNQCQTKADNNMEIHDKRLMLPTLLNFLMHIFMVVRC